MPPLAELQQRMASAILTQDLARMPALVAGPVPAADAFAVYCGTVLGGVTTALRLTFPTVDALVGETFFDQMARACMADRPPRRANLSDYGSAFPDFVRTYPHAAALPYLADVALLDLAVAGALRSPDLDVRGVWAIEPAVGLSLPVALKVLSLNHPADLIRAGLEAEDDAALAAIDLNAGPRHVAVWRAGRAASVRALSPPAGAFLAALVDDAGPDEALAAATAFAEPDTALQAIQTEVFAASFTQIIQNELEGNRP